MQAVDERVPGDVSAAAFWLVAGAIHPDAELTLRDVGVNPTRRAVIDLLRRDGRRHRGAPHGAGRRRRRRRADRRPRRALVDAARRSTLGPADVAAAIDEIPVLCLAAAAGRAARPRIRGAGELRHKESDRIAGIAAGLRALGRPDRRRRRRPRDRRRRRASRGAATDSLDDHRLAMTFAIAGLVADGRDDHRAAPASAAISYPGFFDDLERVRA